MVPIGGIIQWSGAIVNIPAKYAICDGTGTTPDLRDKFVRGAGGALAVDAVGGTTTHKHQQGATPIDAPAAAGNSVVPITLDTDFAGTIPPFHALAYIQRIT